MTEPVTLQLGRQNYRGWQEVRIRLSLSQLADQFELVLTERWSDDVARPVVPGQHCTLSVGDELIVTGWLDEVLPEYDHENHSIAANGRSQVADLVDCSQVPITLGNGLTLAQIARRLCAPYGIDVIDQANVTKAFRSFTLEDGQPIAEALERAAQARGVRLVCDAQGRLVITHALQRVIETPLVLGENVLNGSGYFSDRDRFHTYTVEGQVPGDDNFNSENAAGPRATATDPRVRDTRRILIVADTPLDQAECQARAELESRLRWGQSRAVTYTVQGWTHEQGVWRPGDLVPVRDDYLGIDEPLLVSEVQLIETNDGGRTAELRVEPPGAFEPDPIPDPSSSGLPEGFGYWVKDEGAANG